MKIDIEKIEKTSIEPGDVIVIKMAVNVNREMTELIKSAMKTPFPHNECVVLPPQMTMEVYRQSLTRTIDSCPVCGGDCSSANPPVVDCPMKRKA